MCQCVPTVRKGGLSAVVVAVTEVASTHTIETHCAEDFRLKLSGDLMFGLQLLQKLQKCLRLLLVLFLKS